MCWPESATVPVMWTDETVLRSAVARRAISSALRPASAPPGVLADAPAVP